MNKKQISQAHGSIDNVRATGWYFYISVYITFKKSFKKNISLGQISVVFQRNTNANDI